MTTDHGAAAAALERLEPWGTTPLFDATIAALDLAQPFAGRRALILLSDGDDRYSRTTATEAVEHARQKDVLIYPIALGRTRPPVLAELAAVSGGRSFQASDEAALRTTLSTIARELRFQYLLGYVPEKSRDARDVWHSIEVSVNRQNVKVRARDGYFSR
jgi:Ca-activated chloride channel family protein